MNKTVIVLVLGLALSACAAPVTQPTPDAATPQAGLPNPATVYCTQGGNSHTIQTAADGSQSGMCVFPDGSVCDEWAYFKGTCGPKPASTATASASATATPEGTAGDDPGSSLPPGATEAIADWRGVIKKTDAGAQFDDYFERQDLGQTIVFGIDSRDPVVEAQIESLRDSGKVVHLYGALVSNVPDVNGSQILVSRLVVEE